MSSETLYIEAPQEWTRREPFGPTTPDKRPSVFLAGGITDCPDWQQAIRSMLPPGLIILNPRRENFPMSDPDAARAQITWEFRHLMRADIILFYFPASSSPQPIALYELGRWAASGKWLVVGAADGYLRKTDVQIQMELARPDITVADTLEGTAQHLAEALEKRRMFTG